MLYENTLFFVFEKKKNRKRFFRYQTCFLFIYLLLLLRTQNYF